MLVHIFLHTTKDVVMMIPFLFLMYYILEYIDTHKSIKTEHFSELSHKFGPLIGAFVGVLPQCGVSILASGLYVNNNITLGTLLAVFIATSDEAIPVLFAHPDRFLELIFLIVAKIVIAIITGYIVDFLINKHMIKKYEGTPSQYEINTVHQCHSHHHTLFINAFLRTCKILLFIFICNFILNFVIHAFGKETLSQILVQGSIFQPVISAIVGFIPNCATSIILTQLYVENLLNFGSLTAGLITNAGLGLLTLYRMYDNKKDILRMILILFITAFISSLLIPFILFLI